MTIVIDNKMITKIGKGLLKYGSIMGLAYHICNMACLRSCVDVVDQLTDAGVIKASDKSVDQIGFNIESAALHSREEDDEEEEEYTIWAKTHPHIINIGNRFE